MRISTFILKKIFSSMFDNVRYKVFIEFIDKQTYRNYENLEKPEIHIKFKNKKSQRKAILSNYIGFMESYYDGDIEISGIGDQNEGLRKLIRISYEHKKSVMKHLDVVRITLKLLQEWKLNNRNYLQEKKNLYAHYNMPAEFFHYMNGELYGYTEGYYETGKETQNEAQYKKYDYICRRLLLKPGIKVVEVGSAWGTMSLLMAKKYGADVVNYGLVDEQNRIMEERIIKLGLQDKVKIVQRDCRELGQEKEKYDRYVSLGVIEHAGKDCVEEWIKNIEKALKPGGIGVLTNVGFMGSKGSWTDYLIGKYIWRGCYFPTMPEILNLFDKYNLQLVDLEDTHFLYADTMEVMLSKLNEHWNKIQAINPQIFTEKFKRIWSMYYIGSSESFRSMNSKLHTYQYTFVKGRADVYPRTREFLYKEPFDTKEMHQYEVPIGQDGFPKLKDKLPHHYKAKDIELPFDVDEGEKPKPIKY